MAFSFVGRDLGIWYQIGTLLIEAFRNRFCWDNAPQVLSV